MRLKGADNTPTTIVLVVSYLFSNKITEPPFDIREGGSYYKPQNNKIMKRLTETAMFRQLSTSDSFDPDKTSLKTMYDDFAHAIIDVCTSRQAKVPAYFTLHYTRSEVDQLTLAENTKGAGEKSYQHLSA